MAEEINRKGKKTNFLESLKHVFLENFPPYIHKNC